MRPPSPPRSRATRPGGAGAQVAERVLQPPSPEAAPESPVESKDGADAVRAGGGRAAGSFAGRGTAAVLSRITGAGEVVSNRLSERLTERRAARRRLFARRGLLAGVVAAVAAMLAYVVLLSPLLALRADRVEVIVSADSVDPGEVVAEVAQSAGTPLARLSLPDLQTSVLTVPGVRSATLRRAWPNGVAVEVQAREPVAAVASEGGHVLLDVDAVQVGEPVDAPPADLPVVSVPAGERSADALTAVLAVLDSLPSELLAEIREAGAATADTVRFRLTDGARVEWGAAELSALKVRVLEVLRQRPASVYDVSAPTMPVTR